MLPTFSIRPVLAEDFHAITLDPRHEKWRQVVLENIDSVMAALEPDFSGTVLRGEVPIAIGGIRQRWGWAFISPGLGLAEALVISRVARDRVACYPARNVVAVVDETHPEAVRWARFLGFVRVEVSGRCLYSTVERRP